MNLSSILNATKYFSAPVAIQLLKKASPGIKNYFTDVAQQGLSIQGALDYLTDRFNQESSYATQPDEAALKKQLSNANMPAKLAKTALSFGLPAVGNLFNWNNEGESPNTEINEKSMMPANETNDEFDYQSSSLEPSSMRGRAGSMRNLPTYDLESITKGRNLGSLSNGAPQKINALEIVRQNDANLADLLIQMLENGYNSQQAAAIAKNQYKKGVLSFEKKIGENFVDWFSNNFNDERSNPLNSSVKSDRRNFNSNSDTQSRLYDLLRKLEESQE